MLKTLARNPYCPSMRVDTMSSMLTPLLSTMLVSTVSSMFLSPAQITDPGAPVL